MLRVGIELQKRMAQRLEHSFCILLNFPVGGCQLLLGALRLRDLCNLTFLVFCFFFLDVGLCFFLSFLELLVILVFGTLLVFLGLVFLALLLVFFALLALSLALSELSLLLSLSDSLLSSSELIASGHLPPEACSIAAGS